jgi:hypothetical protein
MLAGSDLRYILGPNSLSSSVGAYVGNLLLAFPDAILVAVEDMGIKVCLGRCLSGSVVSHSSL